MLDLLSKATIRLQKQPLLRQVSGTAIVSGDIHGDIDALNRVIDLWQSEKTDYLILLGDYVDRGLHQLEVVEKIAQTVVDYDNFIPLRGNHEDYRIYSRYGFLEILTENNYDSEPFSSFFSHLPLAAKSDNIFLCHGGLPTDPEFDINDINAFSRSHSVSQQNMLELLWNDPIYDDPKQEKQERLPSRRGGGIWNFGKPVTNRFFNNFGIDLLIRAHIALFDGSKWMQDNKILSLFTAQSGVYGSFRRNVAKLDLNTPQSIEIIDITNDS